MLVFIDYSKAFDTTQHETLITKLANLNFSNGWIKIILSYQRNRQQYVQIVGKKSSYWLIFSVSIPGPIFLNINIYVSSLPSSLKSNSVQYADNDSLHLSNSARNIQFTILILATDIKNRNTWSKNNGLVFKLLSALFTSKRTIYD